MHIFFKLVPIFSFSITASLPWTLAQAQVPSQVCQTLLNNERSYVNWYPLKPLPEIVAQDAVARQLDELQAIAVSPSSLDLTIQTRLAQWLIEKPDPGPPDTGSPALMDGLLKALPTSQKPQLTALLDQARKSDRTLAILFSYFIYSLKCNQHQLLQSLIYKQKTFSNGGASKTITISLWGIARRGTSVRCLRSR